MQYPTLLVADWHLTDSPSDEYRWGLFDWLVETCAAEKVKSLIFLGDLTDRKDNHSAVLTNRVVSGFRRLCDVVKDIKLIPGNHDWLLNGQEYFRFLSCLPNVMYITKPTEDPDFNGQPAFYLPFTKTPAKDWASYDFSHYRYVFMHQTVQGAISSNGEAMEGEAMPDLSTAGKIYSGDIHVPQVIGPVEYVGSPMHVHFGDKFKPRCVLLERGGKAVDLHFETISRITMNVDGALEPDKDYSLRKGDQVKFRISLSESEKHEWLRVRRDALAIAKAIGVEVCGLELVLKKSTRRTLNGEASKRVTPEDAVLRYVEREELGAESLDIALEVIES